MNEKEGESTPNIEVDNKDLSWFVHSFFGSTNPDLPQGNFLEIAKKDPDFLFTPISVLEGKKSIDEVNEDRKGVKRIPSFFNEEYTYKLLKESGSFPTMFPSPVDENGRPPHIAVKVDTHLDDQELREIESSIRPEIADLLGPPSVTQDNLIQFPILYPDNQSEDTA